jgi:diacylglycerol kinase family enzyme
VRAILIVNPRAGAISALADPQASLVQAAEKAGIELIGPPVPVEDLAQAVPQAVAAGADAVLVAGGDGTIATVANLLLGSRTALGVIPGGTMNLLAVRLGLPAQPLPALAALGSAATVPLDVGQVEDRIFLLQAIVGRAARLARFRERQRGRRLLVWWHLLIAALRGLVRRTRRRIALVGGAPPRRVRCHSAIITVPPPGGAPELAVQAVLRQSLRDGVRQAWRWVRGNLAQDPAVESFAATGLALISPRQGIRATLDGEEVLLPHRVRVRLRRGALLVLMPQAAM